MTKTDYIARVMLIMNEAQMVDSEGASFIGAETAQIDRYIEGSYVDAWRRCATVMPRTWLVNRLLPISGVITGYGINNGGSGYAKGDVLNGVHPEDGSGGVLEVSSVNSSGLVEAVKITYGGSGYADGDAFSFTTSSEGIGLDISVSSTKDNMHYTKSEGIGFLVLPDDFYLLSKFKMKGWLKPVYEASIDNERVSSIQSNEYTRGSTIRPVCVIDNKYVDGEIRPVLIFYSLPKGVVSTPVVEEGIYVPMCRALKNMGDEEDIGLDERIIEPMAYLSASTVFTLFEKYDIAKGLEQRVIEMFPAMKTQKGKNITYKQ